MLALLLLMFHLLVYKEKCKDVKISSMISVEIFVPNNPFTREVVSVMTFSFTS